MSLYTVNPIVAGAYGVAGGETVSLDPNDPSVRLNIAAGILTPAEDAKPGRMTCPICQTTHKRPAKLGSPSELAAHYAEQHQGFATPEWRED